MKLWNRFLDLVINRRINGVVGKKINGIGRVPYVLGWILDYTLFKYFDQLREMENL